MEQRKHSGLESKYLNLSYSIKGTKRKWFCTHIFSLIGAHAHTHTDTHTVTQEVSCPKPPHLGYRREERNNFLTYITGETEDSGKEGPWLNPQSQLVYGTSGRRIKRGMVADMV